MRKDPVTHEVALTVFTRDKGCVAVELGAWASECHGRLRLEHVQDGGGRMGKRAKSDPSHLVALCEGHTEPGMKAGYVWCTDRKNRDLMRQYLAAVS